MAGDAADRVNMDATTLSADGSVAVGNAINPCCNGDGLPPLAARWTRTTGWQPLGELEEGMGSYANTISADGRVIVGGSALVTFRWTETDGMVGLGTDGDAFAINSDRNVIVGGDDGGKTDDNSLPAFVWTHEFGLLEFEPGVMLDVSADGTVAIGYVAKGASVWDQANGLRDLRTVLIDEHGLAEELENWQLTQALQLSDDATTVLGWGIAPSGEESTWIARLDRPLVTAQPLLIGDANVDGEFSSADLVKVFQAGKYEIDVDATWSEGDWNADQRFNTSDLVAAFQAGGYEQGPGGNVQAVPEPTSISLTVVALGLLLAITRDTRNLGSSFANEGRSTKCSGSFEFVSSSSSYLCVGVWR